MMTANPTPAPLVVPLVVLLVLMGLVAGCTGGEPAPAPGVGGATASEPSAAPATLSTGAPATVAPPLLSPTGDPRRTPAAATWRVARGEPVDQAATVFTAEVARLDCNSGVTGRVLDPTVVETDERVVITFTVAPSGSRTSTCQGNVPVPAPVRLVSPVGDRVLVDGACLPGGAAVTTSFCNRDGVRFDGVARDRG